MSSSPKLWLSHWAVERVRQKSMDNGVPKPGIFVGPAPILGEWTAVWTLIVGKNLEVKRRGSGKTQSQIWLLNFFFKLGKK